MQVLYTFILLYVSVRCFYSPITIYIIFQDILPEGATIVPNLFGIEETYVTVLGNISCRSLYLTIENLPKKVCCTYSQHAYELVAYLPILKATGREADKRIFTQAKRGPLPQVFASNFAMPEQCHRKVFIFF